MKFSFFQNYLPFPKIDSRNITYTAVDELETRLLNIRRRRDLVQPEVTFNSFTQTWKEISNGMSS